MIEYLQRIGLSLLLGLLIGFERDQQQKPAGIRDVALVSLGATLFTVIGLQLIPMALTYEAPIRYDIGRIIAYTIVSIGFLGSGVIIQTKNKLEGITTATILWVMVAIGLLCGIGQYLLASISGLVVYLLLKLKYFRIKFETEAKRWKKRKRRR